MTTEATYPELSKIVVLCGVGCGGTTLMLDMLRAHPRVFGPFELGCMMASDLSIDAFAGITHDVDIYAVRLDLFGFEKSRLANLIDEVVKDGGSWLAFYHRIFDEMVRDAKLPGRDVFVDKQLDYAGSLLSHVYPKMPDVPAIIIVRDPRAVYCAWRKRRPQNPPEAMAQYSHMMYGAVNALDAGKPVMLVRFEDLVLSPEPYMREVARFLGLDYDPAMTSPANSYDQHIKTKFTFPPWNEQKRRLRPTALDSTAVDEWRELLDPGEVDAVMARLPDDLHWTLHDSGKELPRWP